MDLPCMGKMDATLETMRDNPILDRVIGGLVWLVIFAVAFLLARCLGWNLEELKR